MDAKNLAISSTAAQLFLRHGYRKVTMSDIADASGISRPSLYAAFSNKEDIFSAIVDMQITKNQLETAQALTKKKKLKARLNSVFDIWIIQPFAAAIDSENGKDMVANGALYAPTAIAHMYKEFELSLVDILSAASSEYASLSATDTAHILMLATKGLKASSDDLDELKRLTDGLIAMTVATFGTPS